MILWNRLRPWRRKRNESTAAVEQLQRPPVPISADQPAMLEEPAVPVAAQEPSGSDAPLTALPEPLAEWYQISSWFASRQWLAAHLTDLPPDAETTLRQVAVHARERGDEDDARLLTRHAEVLALAQREDVDAAYRSVVGQAAFEEPREDDRAALSRQLVEWMRSPNLEASRQYLREHPVLLSDQAEQVLELIERSQTDADVQHLIREFRQLLHTVCQAGVDAAYDDFLGAQDQRWREHMQDSSPDMLQMLEEVFALAARDADPDLRVVLCRRILAMDDTTHMLGRELRGTICSFLGTTLQSQAEMIADDGAVALFRRAIAAHDLALELVTPTEPLYSHSRANKGVALTRLAERLSGPEAIVRLEQALECFDADLADLTPSNPDYAMDQMNKGIALHILAERLSGPEAIVRLEQAIAAHDLALDLRPAGSPEHARSLIGKANALQRLADHLNGSEASRCLSRAIEAYNAALEILDPATVSFALAQTNKANAMRTLAEQLADPQAIKVLGQAIAACERALDSLDPGDPNWAKAYASKGSALKTLAERLGGLDAVERLRQAVHAYDMALTILAPTSPDYTRIQINKGDALRLLAMQQSGLDAISHLEKALAAFDVALGLLNPSSLEYGHAQMDKSVALVTLAERLGGSEALERLKQAIQADDEASTVFAADTIYFARTLTNKGIALTALSEHVGTPASSACLAEALKAFDAASAVIADTSLDFGKIQANRGKALLMMAVQLDGADAIRCLELVGPACDVALRVFSPTSFAAAHTHLHKGGALARLAEWHGGTRAVEELERAIQSYSSAVQILSVDIVPKWHRVAANDLAHACFALCLLTQDATLTQARLEEAWKAASSGLAAARMLERLAPSRAFREVEWRENVGLYALAAVIQTRRRNYRAAIALLEEGRGKGLAEVLGRRQTALNVLEEAEREEYLAAANAVTAIEARGRSDSESMLVLAEEAHAANAWLDEVVRRLQTAHPKKFLPEHAIALETLVQVLRLDEVLVYLIPHMEGTLVLLLTHDARIVTAWLGDLTLRSIRDLAMRKDANSAYRLGYLPAACGFGNTTPLDHELESLLPQLGDKLMRRVVEMAGTAGAKRMILVAGGMLSVLPLHAASYPPPAPENAPTAPDRCRYVCDDMAISYAPSGYVLASARRARAALHRQGKPGHGLVVGNPQLTPPGATWTPETRNYLRYAQEEASIIGVLMQAAGMQVDLKMGAEADGAAVLAGLNRADVAHLAMHATFDVDDPLDSALLVAPGARLSLRELLDEQRVAFAQLRLAVLSACQTGIGDFQRLSEEAFGLFGALLAGGAMGVVGSLWSVNDYSTQALMAGFMRRYLMDGQEPAIALHNAMRALRRLPDELVEQRQETRQTLPAAQGQLTATLRDPDEDYAATEREWRAEREAEPIEARRYSLGGENAGTAEGSDGDTDSERWPPLPALGSARRSSRQIPLSHPFYWAAFVYHGA